MTLRAVKYIETPPERVSVGFPPWVVIFKSSGETNSLYNDFPLSRAMPGSNPHRGRIKAWLFDNGVTDCESYSDGVGFRRQADAMLCYLAFSQ